MCGIVGYIGNKTIDKELVDGLKLLEYRGYDSAGVAVLKNDKIYTTKAEGNISCLEKILKNEENATVGIAHTRWATHGKPSINNAHPHISSDKEWAVVHNGIIENFGQLKNDLQHNNFTFSSETDTEVIAHLLQQLNCEDKINTVIKTCKMLEGSFALAIINKNIDGTIYLAKRKSPLYISLNNAETFVASDPICFAGKTQSYYSLNDDEFCEAKIGKLIFYNLNGETISKKPIEMTDFDIKIDKQNYAHFMLKEIQETPSILKRIVQTYKDNNAFDKINNQILKNINKIILVGCGTAYHAGLVGASFIEKFAKIEARCFVASEFRYNDPLIDDKTLAIFVSQSGETADTIMAHELAKQKGAITIALTNVLYSSLAKKVDFIFPICAGPEIAVASTKAYTAQISILNMFAKHLCNVRNNTNFNFIDSLSNLANTLKILDINCLEDISKELINEKTMFFIGRGLDYFTCEEASLKLKEITYINSQAYPAGELKHGFLALVENGTHVFVIATQKALLDKTLNGAHEASARGAKLVIATQFDIPKSQLKDIYKIISLQNFDEDLMPIASIGAFQMLSYLTSTKKGINPDQPRNLAKSVTVE
ncbi:MAG: glutamine--fructose-6-phosphate transaminase (isomerizing) [Clostridia bacterium]|nr:glutamine--fructose-6-phosphate transaminase (isomerizing) [Clostridia bacterium]